MAVGNLAGVSSPPARSARPPLYPYEFAIINAILLLFALATIAQPGGIDLRPRITGSIALATIAALHLWKTRASGYLPGEATNPRLEGRRNVAGGFTVVAVGLDIVAIVGLLSA